VIDLIKTKYPDFGATLAGEKLAKLDGVKLSEETLRKWMIQEGIWKAKKRKRERLTNEGQEEVD
jgi:hypothetical protein